MPGIASAATAVVIGHVAGGTTTIRVGAGGIMLPNHSPLVIAEQFGTLESLYPGPHRPRPRPRARHRPARRCARCAATRRAPTTFPQDVVELQALLRARAAGPSSCRRCRAPGSSVPLWILGSSLFGAQLAAALGLPYAFASHFAPDALDAGARDLPRDASSRRRSSQQPYAMVGVNVVARRHRRRGAAAVHLGAAGVREPAARRARAAASRRSTTSRRYWTPAEKAHASRDARAARSSARRRRCVRGSRRSSTETGADELIVAAAIYDHAARLRSYELLAGLRSCAT